MICGRGQRNISYLDRFVRGSCNVGGAFFFYPRFRFRAHNLPARATTVIVQVYRDKPAPLHFREVRVIVARAMNFMTDTCGEFVNRKEIMRRDHDRVARNTRCNVAERSIDARKYISMEILWTRRRRKKWESRISWICITISHGKNRFYRSICLKRRMLWDSPQLFFNIKNYTTPITIVYLNDLTSDKLYYSNRF